MADFSEYTGPSQEWLALEPNLPVPPENLSVEELKKAANEGREAVAARDMVEQGLQSRVTIRDHFVTARDGASIETRSYRPSSLPGSQPLPVYIHLHGGGFLFGTLSSEDAICSRIVTALEDSNFPVVVFNVNYRHTPEAGYPAAWNDVEDSFHWVHDHLAEIGGDGDKLVLGGISAGAWLTASVMLSQHLSKSAELAKRPKIRGQVLMIPCLVHPSCYEQQLKKLKHPHVSSYVQNADAPILPVSRINLFTSLVGITGAENMARDTRLNPGNALPEEVKGLPPTTFGVAGRDPLRDEGLLYAQLLSENGVPTSVNVFSGLPHGFRRYADKLSESKRWDAVMCDGIKWALSNPVATGKLEIKVQ